MKKANLITLPNGKEWHRPTSRHYLIDLDGKDVEINISFGLGNVPAKLYCLGRLVREADGTPRTMNVRVQATTIKCKVSGKVAGEIKASSYCKPPDAFCIHTGIHLAVKHLFRRDCTTLLTKKNRAAILALVCPWLGKAKTESAHDKSIKLLASSNA